MSESKSDVMNTPPVAPTAADVVMAAVSPEVDPAMPVERPVITKLELENFKSYAGLKTIGPCHHRFNSIIGPNGSGKSNVIDAMMFVFGKRAKKLRLKKVSELIHHSAEFPNFGYARVNVHFVNIVDDVEGDGVTPVPGTECVISRVAKKDNSSQYKINNKSATFAQVADELAKRNIDLKNNRFLILQGEVELISQMKPLATSPNETGLLEYLEDIIGSNKYVEPIAKASAEYDGAEEMRTQAKNRMRASEKTREGLRGSRDDVLAFKNAQRAVAKNRNILWHKRRIERANEALRVSKERADLAEMRNEAASEFQEEENRINGMMEEIKKIKKNHSKLEKETDDWREKYAQFERKDVKMREDLIHSKAEKKKLSKIQKKSVLMANACREKIEQLEADAPSREEDVNAAKKALEEAEGQLEAVEATLKGKTEALRTELKQARSELKPLGKLADTAKAEVDEYKSEIDLVQSRSISARKTYEKLQKDLMNAQECVEGHGEAVARLQQETAQKSARCEEATQELSAVSQHETEIGAQIETLRDRRDEIQNELASAQTSVSGTKATGMLAALQSEEAGVGNDLLGRLGDLGGIDRQYDVAISTAAGALNNLVCRTVDGAQKCIDYLRAKKLGRATFIVLEKIQYLQEQMNQYVPDKMSKKEKCPRLFDLVRPRDEEVTIAFYYAMRNTLVAKTLDQASKVAYKGTKCIHRIVSMKGELIELSGTMSGGGGKARSGLMGEEATAFSSADAASALEAEATLKSIESSLAAADVEYTTLCKERDQLRKRRQHLEKEIRTLKTFLKKSTTKLSKMALNVKASVDLLPDLTRNVQEIRPTIDITDEEKERISTLEQTLQEKTKIYKSAHSNTVGLERKVEELQSSIMNVGGNDLKRAKAVQKNFAKRLKDAEAKITKTAVDIKALEKKIETSAKDSKKAEKEYEKIVKLMTETIEAIKTLDAHATECVNTFNAVQASEQETKEQVATQEKEWSIASKALKKRSSSVEELDDSLKEMDEKHERIQHELSVWEEKITSLINTFNADDTLTTRMDDEVEDLQQQNSDGDGGDGDGDGDDDDRTNDAASDDAIYLLKTPTVLEMEEANMKELETSISTLESKITNLRNEIDMSALDAYNKAHSDWKLRVSEFDSATTLRDTSRSTYEILRKERLNTFMTGFSVITLKLKEMYQMITLGGDAELELVDTLDPFAEGIVFR